MGGQLGESAALYRHNRTGVHPAIQIALDGRVTQVTRSEAVVL